MYLTYQCHAEHAPDLPEDIRKLIYSSAEGVAVDAVGNEVSNASQGAEDALRKVEDFLVQDKKLRSIITTTQVSVTTVYQTTMLILAQSGCRYDQRWRQVERAP